MLIVSSLAVMIIHCVTMLVSDLKNKFSFEEPSNGVDKMYS